MLRTNLISCDFILPRRGQAIVWHYLLKFYPGPFPSRIVGQRPAGLRTHASRASAATALTLAMVERTSDSAFRRSNNLLYLYTQPYDVVGPAKPHRNRSWSHASEETGHSMRAAASFPEPCAARRPARL